MTNKDNDRFTYNKPGYVKLEMDTRISPSYLAKSSYLYIHSSAELFVTITKNLIRDKLY